MISKKIQKTDKRQSLRAYVYSVVSYVTNPDTTPDLETGKVNKDEKCVAVYSNCLYDNEVKGIVDEIVDTVKGRDATSGSKPIVHRILSFKKGERPSEQQCFDIAKEFMLDLGYNESHQYIIAIHNNTDNLHMHIVSNRYSTFDGSLLEEGGGWDQLESRRSCARIEKKYGLSPEPNSRFIAAEQTEKTHHTNPFTGEVIERERACIEQVGKSKRTPDVRDRAKWMELKTGLKSQQRIMQEIFSDIKPLLNDKLNFGKFYRLLAQHGVEVEAVKHGKNWYLTYSLDGEQWEKPSNIDSDFTTENLIKTFKSTVRKPKEELRIIAKEARRIDDVHVTDDVAKKIAYSKEQIASLRTIPIKETQKAFGLSPTENKKIRNSIDVLIYQKNMQYNEAVEQLANKFPNIISGEDLVNTINIESIQKRLESAGVPDALKRSGTDVLRQLDAWGADKFFVYGNAPERNFSSAQMNQDGWTKEDVLQNLPFLASMNIEGGHIYINPQYDNNKIKIPVDDVQKSFIEQYRPSLTIKTSENSQQAHYVIEKKYEKQFYDILTEHINARWGDSKIKTSDHDSRLAGFTNRKPAYEKDGKFPFVKVVQSTPVRCIEFENFVEQQYILYKQGKLKPLTHEKVLNVSTIDDRENAMQNLEERSLSPLLTNHAIVYQNKISDFYGNKIDRSKADYMTADFLYRSNATPEQVYTFLCHNAMQNDDLVSREHKDGSTYNVRKNITEKQQDRYARRTAINVYYEKGHIQRETIKQPNSNNLLEKLSDNTSTNRWKKEQLHNAPITPVPYIHDQTNSSEQIQKDTQIRVEKKLMQEIIEQNQKDIQEATQKQNQVLDKQRTIDKIKESEQELMRQKISQEKYDTSYKPR